MTEVRRIGRYALFEEIASGGMATVHLARLLGPVGFSRTVAIKRLHAAFARDPEFVSAFLDEARLAARIRHPNVVPTLDVVASQGELFLVMEYVHGEPLAQLVRACAEAQQRIPQRIAVSLVSGALQGLHAAHEARDERGMSLDIVHRDVSPHNIMVGTDGMPRVLDFGVAKAAGRAQATRDGVIKGKIAYMAPEQVELQPISRIADVYSASVVLWELLTGRRLFTGDSQAVIMARVLMGEIPRPSTLVADVSPALDAIVMRGLAHDPAARFQTAREMALALDREASASLGETAEWLEQVAGPSIAARAAKVVAIETSPGPSGSPEDTRSRQVAVKTALAEAPPSPTGRDTPIEARGAPSRGPSRTLVAAVLVAFAASAGVAFLWSRGDRTPRDPTAAEPAAPRSASPPAPTSSASAAPPPEPAAAAVEVAEPSSAASAPSPAPRGAAAPPRRAAVRPAEPASKPPSSRFDLGGRE